MTFATRAAGVTKFGIPVIPINSREKKATLPNWPKRATTDAAQIAKWDKENPDYNCASVGRKGGFWYLDADKFVSLSESVDRETEHQLDSIDTLLVKSSEGKLHLYFKHDARSEALGNFSASDANGGELFSVRALNEYVVAPGSIHPSGSIYETISEPTFGDIPTAPDWLMDWLEKAKRVSNKQKAKVSADPEAKISEGSRDEFLFAEACRLRDAKVSQKAALAALVSINRDRCVPPMPDSILKIKIKSAYTRESRLKLTSDVQTNVASNESSAQIVVPLVRPVLDEKAFYGLAGRIIKRLEPETESDPAGLLVQLLVSFGNVIGRNAYWQVEDTKHFTNEFVVTVGRSSRARKGTGRNRIRAIFNLVDPEWLTRCNKSGIGSGEIIIHLIRDPRHTWVVDKRTGKGDFVMSDRGVDDKRLCASLGEFQSILAACNRADSQMSVVMRDGWDGMPLHNLVKTDPASCEKGHLSLMADTTLADLTVSLNQADRNNGFANRFLWVYVDRAKMLPDGGNEIAWGDEISQLQDAVEFGKQTGRMFMDDSARDRWRHTLYSKLEREIPGIVGAITGRASSHTRRLAMLYALLDKSDHIRAEHLEAAAALWQYCEDSAQTIFGDLLSPDQAKILEFLTVHGTVTKTQLIHECFKGHRRADLIQFDLDILKSREKITVTDVNDIPSYSVKR